MTLKSGAARDRTEFLGVVKLRGQWVSMKLADEQTDKKQ